MNLKLTNKIEIIFEKNIFWYKINQELIVNLSKRLNVNIIFVKNLTEFKIIKTFLGSEVKVFIKLI